MAISKPRKVTALAGAARRIQGAKPLKNPATPSLAKVWRAQSMADEYWRVEDEKPSVCNLDLITSMGYTVALKGVK